MSNESRMKFYVIVGLGPNDIKIPALIFSSRSAAEKAMKKAPADMDADSDLSAFYTDYYGGCGECWKFEIREVKEGKPFVVWDLD